MSFTADDLRHILPKAAWNRVAKQLGVIEYGAAGRRRKYNAKPTLADGIRFDSKREAQRYHDLQALRLAGGVRWFARQPRFVLDGGVEYVADFVVVYADGRVMVEDVKGFRTKTYRLKRRQVCARYGLEIQEV